MASKKQTDSIDIRAVEMREIRVHIVGTSPLIMNRMTEKVRQGLLLGGGKKTAAEKAGTAKHNPIAEYRSSVYRMPAYAKADTVLGLPSSAFKAALETAALETPGAKKAQIGRLVSVPWINFRCYGEPLIFSTITRSADMNRTPDIRTRAILPRWASVLDLKFVVPTLTTPMILTLLANAGLVCGVGDFRQEKGAGSFGLFRIADADDAEFASISLSGKADVQEAALENPQPFDQDTADLLEYHQVEIRRRGLRVA